MIGKDADDAFKNLQKHVMRAQHAMGASTEARADYLPGVLTASSPKGSMTYAATSLMS